tara:strand:- start:121 stop:258 length:138 start_codon:yes stop_codon:yes gene_type:complete
MKAKKSPILLFIGGTGSIKICQQNYPKHYELNNYFLDSILKIVSK